MSPPSSSSSDDKHGVNEQKYSFRLHQRVITPTRHDRGRFHFFKRGTVFSLSRVGIKVHGVSRVQIFSRVEEFLKLLRRPGRDTRVTHRQYNEDEDGDGFGIVLDDAEEDEGEAKLD